MELNYIIAALIAVYVAFSLYNLFEKFKIKE